jgi:hypothetical protein
MSAFEDFVTQELPKRGYLNTDVSAETIIVRRGPGPRQFDAVQLGEGQVLAKVGGLLVGVSVKSIGGGVRSITLPVTNLTTWVVTHNLGSENVIIQAFDNEKFVLIPNTMQIIDANTVELTFNSPQTGIARVIFLD